MSDKPTPSPEPRTTLDLTIKDLHLLRAAVGQAIHHNQNTVALGMYQRLHRRIFGTMPILSPTSFTPNNVAKFFEVEEAITRAELQQKVNSSLDLEES
jgi:hypothetical protein